MEFFLHFLDQVERVNSGKPELDPSRSFKFIIEERLQCPSGKVAYNKRSDYILSLSIPLHEATNKGNLLNPSIFLILIFEGRHYSLLLMIQNSLKPFTR